MCDLFNGTIGNRQNKENLIERVTMLAIVMPKQVLGNVKYMQNASKHFTTKMCQSKQFIRLTLTKALLSYRQCTKTQYNEPQQRRVKVYTRN